MNPNFLGRMVNGAKYKSHLGITGIKAVKNGEAAFSTFCSELGQAIGELPSLVFQDSTRLLPKQGLVRFPNVGMLFLTGAENAAQGNVVLGGLADTYHDASNPCWNLAAAALMFGRWYEHLNPWYRSVNRMFIFGHSYGGVCAEALADRLYDGMLGGELLVETYGSPRACIPSKMNGGRNWQRTRNVHVNDIVSHIPYHTSEAPWASAMTPTATRTAFDASGHSQYALAYQFNGTCVAMPNNPVAAQDTTLSMLGWVTYANHITSRDHELDTYVSTMTAAALAGPLGTLPAATVTSIPAIALPTAVPSGPDVVVGVPLTPEQLYQQIMQEEETAAAEYFHRPVRPHARGVRNDGIAGVRFMDVVGVAASDLRSAKGLAKRLNRIRRILGPLPTDQRAQILAMAEADFTGE